MFIFCRVGDWCGYTVIDGEQTWDLQYYNFKHTGVVGHFKTEDRNIDDEFYTIEGRVWEDDGIVHIAFDKTYPGDSPTTLLYAGTLDQQAETFSGSFHNKSQKTEGADDGNSVANSTELCSFSFKRTTPEEIRKGGPPAYLVDAEQTRKLCILFFEMRYLLEDDSNAGEQLFRLLSAEEYRTHWAAYRGMSADSELWHRMPHH